MNFIYNSYLFLNNIFSSHFNVIYNDILTDSIFKLNLINSILYRPLTTTEPFLYLDLYYDYLIQNNWAYLVSINNFSYSIKSYFGLYELLKSFIKINIILFIIYTIFFISYLENYIKQVFYINNLTKLFILNESEKEVGPVDDFIFFAILFLLTLCSFIIVSLLVILLHSSIFIWIFASLFLVSILILTVPLNLFFDFGISFFVYIRGSASSNSLIKELLFDIISAATVFIRFVVQNVRFLFIFSAIFELLEWVFANNSSLFLTNYYTNYNIFVNFTSNNYLFSNGSLNILIINSILFIILYLYYFLHLLFLLLVQITVYIGISIWLFFFLYSTRFLGKYEKFFIYKR
jgi:hypothetical protein